MVGDLWPSMIVRKARTLGLQGFCADMIAQIEKCLTQNSSCARWELMGAGLCGSGLVAGMHMGCVIGVPDNCVSAA